MASSAVGRLGRATLERWRAAWDMQPPDTRRVWRRTLFAGAVALPLVTVALIAIGRALVAAGALDWETDWLRRLAGSSFSFSSAVWFQTFGSDVALAVLILLIVGIAVWRGRPLLAMAIPLAWIGVDLTVRLGWLIWARDRPDLVFGGAAAPGFHAFPSGHAGKTFAVYGLLTWVWVRASQSWLERAVVLAGFLFLAVIVPVGRMRMGAHWPSDVIAGALIGAFWLAVLIGAIRREVNALR